MENKLRTKIAELITGEPSKMLDGTDDPFHGMDVVNNMDTAAQIRAKIREMVESHNSIDYPYSAEFKQAILKALDREEE